MAITSQDIDLMARTMVAENSSASPDEYRAIANVIRNRLLNGQWGGTVGQVLLAKTEKGGREFTPWATPGAANYPARIDSKSPAYQSAYSIASDVMGGESKDPTNGAIYYYAPKTQAAMGEKTPFFAKGREGVPIGQHTFYGPMPDKNKIGEDDYAHLITGKPQPSQVAGEEVTPSGPGQVAEDDYNHLITGKPAPKAVPKYEPPPEPDLSAGFGIVGKGFKEAPAATAAIGAPLAAGAALPFLGLGSAGMAALPYWASIPIGLGLSRGLADVAGAPGTAKATGTLLDLLKAAGERLAP